MKASPRPLAATEVTAAANTSREASAVRDQLLDTAERLFAEKGVGATSVRDITSAAGANVASVNYYFGSREGLLRALIARRMEPLNQERLRRLASLSPEARGAPGILKALAEPSIDLCFEQPHFARLASRLRAELDASLWQEYRDHQAEVTQRFQAAFQAALPHLSAAEVSTRLHYVLGGLQHLWAHCPLSVEQSPEVVRRQFLSFYGAGLQAPGGEGKGI